MSLDWDDLKVLLAVARSGSLNGAATLLGVDQATASRHGVPAAPLRGGSSPRVDPQQRVRR